MPTIRIDTSKIEDFSKKLGTLHKSAFPNAVRGTLNSLAFDVKQNTLLDSAKKNFVQRDKNFFRANSRVVQARGWNIAGMASVVGLVSLKGTNKAVDDLEQQEHGGQIGGKSFIPMKGARTGNNYKGKVRKPARISGVRNMVVASKNKGRNERQRFVLSALHAGVGGHVLSERMIVWRINSMKRKNGLWKFKMTPLYSFRKGRKVQVKATNFMREAVSETVKKTHAFYKKEAERQFQKHFQK